MKYVGECLCGENVEVKIAACKCLHSLSRSTKLLRTTIIDNEVWKHILEVHTYVCVFVRVHVYTCAINRRVLMLSLSHSLSDALTT